MPVRQEHLSLEDAARLICHCRIFGGASVVALTRAADRDQGAREATKQRAAIAALLEPFALDVDATLSKSPPLSDVAILANRAMLVGSLQTFKSLCEPGTKAQRSTARGLSRAAREAEARLRALGLDVQAVLDRAQALSQECGRVYREEVAN